MPLRQDLSSGGDVAGMKKPLFLSAVFSGGVLCCILSHHNEWFKIQWFASHAHVPFFAVIDGEYHVHGDGTDNGVYDQRWG